MSGERGGRGWCIAVTGGSGGVGASTFAAVLAWLAGATLVDLDEHGGGADVLLGLEREPGTRWSDLRLSGGRLEPRALLGGLPRWLGTPVLAADGPLPAGGLGPVIDAVSAVGPVVLDVPRGLGPAGDEVARNAGLLLMLAQARVAALAAARAVLAGWPELACGVLLRPGEIPEDEAARLVGRPVLGWLPALRRPPELAAGRPPRALMAVALGVLDGIDEFGGLPGGPDGGAGAW